MFRQTNVSARSPCRSMTASNSLQQPVRARVPFSASITSRRTVPGRALARDRATSLTRDGTHCHRTVGSHESVFDGMRPAGRSSPKTYQTCRAWGFICPNNRGRSARDDDLDLAARSESGRTLEFWRNRMQFLSPSTGGAEAVVGVTVRRGVPVTVRRADVRRLIVERPAPKKTRVWSSPAGRSFYETGRIASDRYWHGERVQSSS
jgi:hypothetical protein